MLYNKPRDVSFRGAPSPKKLERLQKRGSRPAGVSLSARTVPFFVALVFGLVIAFVLPLRPTYSATEKRTLAKFPEFSVKSLLSGDYFDGISLWFSDTFPGREFLTKMDTSLNSLKGFDSVAIHGDVEGGDEIPDAPKVPLPTLTVPSTDAPTTTEPTTLPPTTKAPTTTQPPQTTAPATTQSSSKISPDDVQTLGAILVAGNSGYEYYNYSSAMAPRFIDSVSGIKAAAGGNCNVYAMIAPTSMDITLDDAIRADVSSSDQKKALDYFNSSFRDCTPIVGLYESLRAHRDEYEFFRTDHHWTQLGAYRAYELYAGAKGIAPVPLEAFESVTYKGFLGSFYSATGQSDKLGKTPDSVTVYKPFTNCDMTITNDGSTYAWPVIANGDTYDASNKYLCLLGGDNALVSITNNDVETGATCLVIKDSFANAFVPFLIAHYKQVYVIDPRHYEGTLSGFCADTHVDDIVFLSNISTTRNNVFIEAMEGFIQ